MTSKVPLHSVESYDRIKSLAFYEESLMPKDDESVIDFIKSRIREQGILLKDGESRAVVYDPDIHSERFGEIAIIAEEKMFFPYVFYPHGHYDCPHNSTYFDTNRSMYQEISRKSEFCNYLNPTPGLERIDMYVRDITGKIYFLSCSILGRLFKRDATYEESRRHFVKQIDKDLSSFDFPLTFDE